MKIITSFFLVIQLLLLALIGFCIIILVIKSVFIYLIKIVVIIKENIKNLFQKIHRSSLITASMNYKNK
jgi:hypothetical protein